MRYSPEYKAKARAKLIRTAGALAKQNGFGTTGVEALMKAAGFTTGAFYSHFGSREELLKGIVESELTRANQQFEGKSLEDIRRALSVYLSRDHVEHPETGCPLPSLSAEVARADVEIRRSYEHLLLEMRDDIAAKLGNADAAWAAISQAVGAVMIARALASDGARDEVLAAARREIDQLVETSVAKTSVAKASDPAQ